MRFAWSLLGLALLGAGNAQTTTPAAAKPVGWLLVLNKPYEGVREYTREQKQPDGTVLKMHQTNKSWRDSAGRIREERSGDRVKVVWTYLTDPAAKVQYRWNKDQKIVYVSQIGDPIPAVEQTHPLAAGEVRDVTARVDGVRLKSRVSLLPPKTVDGLETLGTHQVSYSDAERTQLVATNDYWMQMDFRVVLDQTIDDEHYGHRMWHYASFKPGEPKAELFQVPKGYVVKQAESAESEQFE